MVGYEILRLLTTVYSQANVLLPDHTFIKK